MKWLSFDKLEVGEYWKGGLLFVELTSRSERLMGSTITVSISHQQADQILADCFSLLRSYEHRFSANDPSSELMEVNQRLALNP